MSQFTLTKSEDNTIRVTVKGEVTSFKSLIDHLKAGVYEGEIKKKPSKPTWNMFKYYRGGILPYIATENGEMYPGIPRVIAEKVLKSIHEDILATFAPKIEQRNRFDKRKKTVCIVRSGQMDKEQFTDFINNILLFFPSIPSPEDHKAQLLYEAMKEYRDYFKN